MVKRAESAPADIVPGLLSSTLEAAGRGVRVGGGASCTFSSVQSRTASGVPPKKLSGTPHPNAPPTFEVRSSTLRALPSLVQSLHDDDLLIAIERPPPANDRALAIGIAGRGFDGNLTSDSTRLDGYVLSTDVAPTILRSPRRRGSLADVGTADPLGGLGRRRRGRLARGPDGDDLGAARAGDRASASLVWLVALGLAIAAMRGRAARPGVRLVGLSVVYLPLLLLAGAALEPSQTVEQLLVMVGAPLLAALTLAALGGYRALAVASGLTVFAYAIDVIAGSPLTSLSLLGPNPGLGVRFYGIGNELEALLGVLVVAGTGAGLAGFAPRLSAKRLRHRLPLGRAAARLRLRRRPVRRRRRRGDRPAGRGGLRRGDRRRAPPAHGAAGDRAAVPGRRPAGPGRPPLRGQRPPHPLGPRRRRLRRPRPGRPAPPPALRP